VLMYLMNLTYLFSEAGEGTAAEETSNSSRSVKPSRTPGCLSAWPEEETSVLTFLGDLTFPRAGPATRFAALHASTGRVQHRPAPPIATPHHLPTTESKSAAAQSDRISPTPALFRNASRRTTRLPAPLATDSIAQQPSPISACRVR
jgi:hypothetical protein